MAPRKRTLDEVEAPSESSSPSRSAKQHKTDSAAAAAAESNSESSYVSAAAAVFSDSEGGEQETAPSDADEFSSELSTSSEEPSSASESEDENADEGSRMQEDRINVRAGGKPNITKESSDGSLLRRLRTFLPEMKDADEQLDREREDGTLGDRNMESYEEGGPHIEMNLGLGVLKEQRPGEDSDSEDEMTDDTEDDDGQAHVMEKLMGGKRPPRRDAQIQEVGDG